MARRRLERERVEQARLRAADVDRAQLPVRDGEERVAVRLDDVGLVDALLLDVRAGVVDALLGSCRAAPSPRASGDIVGPHAAPKPYGPTKRFGVRLRVGEQLAARAERGQARRFPAASASRSAVVPQASGGQRRAASAARSATRLPKLITLVIRHRQRNRHPRRCDVLGGAGTLCAEGLSNRVMKGAPNELALDHPDRRARAGFARIFRPRPLLDRPRPSSGLGRPALAGRPFLRDSVEVDVHVADLLARADAAPSLPKLGGMARPNGVVIVSERYWAFANLAGELHEGEMPVRRSSGCAGSRSSAACCSWRRRWRRSSAAAASPGSASGFSSSSRCLLPLRVRRAAGPARARRRHPDDRADHPLALPRPDAAPARRRAPRDRGGRGAARWRRPGRARRGRRRFSARCGTNFAALAIPVTALFDRARAALPRPHAARGARRGRSRSASRWSSGRRSQHPSGVLRGFLLPGLALQRLTTREPQLADTQIALRAVASVLRRELTAETR